MTQFMRWLTSVPRSISGHHYVPHIYTAWLMQAQAHRSLPNRELCQILARLSPWTVLHRQKANTHILKPYFKKHQLLRYPGESTPKAGTQCSRNCSYFRKLNYAISKRGETTYLHFLMWSKSEPSWVPDLLATHGGFILGLSARAILG